MTDEALRRAERRATQTGADEDQARFRAALTRAGRTWGSMKAIEFQAFISAVPQNHWSIRMKDGTVFVTVYEGEDHYTGGRSLREAGFHPAMMGARPASTVLVDDDDVIVTVPGEARVRFSASRIVLVDHRPMAPAQPAQPQ